MQDRKLHARLRVLIVAQFKLVYIPHTYESQVGNIPVLPNRFGETRLIVGNGF